MAAPFLWAPHLLFLQENLHAHKILVLRGGGSANFIFMGVGILLQAPDPEKFKVARK